MIINPKDVDEALQWDMLQHFGLYSTTGNKTQPGLTRKAALNKVFWMSYVTIIGYYLSSGSYALWIHENQPNFDPDKIGTFLNLIRAGDGRPWDSVNNVLQYEQSTHLQTIPINKLFKKGWKVILELQKLDYMADAGESEVGINIWIHYKVFDTKSNEFGQFDDLLTDSRFPQRS